MIRRRLSLILALLLVVAFAGACDELLTEENGTDYLEALVGTWVTVQHVITNNANASDQVDLFAAGGRTTLVIEADGDFSVSFIDSSGTWNDSGTIEADASTLTLTTDEEVMTMSYLLVAGVLTITYTNSSYDFDDNGTDEDATELMVFQHPEDSGDLELTDLAGSFMGTHFIWSDPAGVHDSQDQIAMGGYFTLKMDAAGNVDVIQLLPGNDEEDGAMILTGTAALAAGGDSLAFTFTEAEASGTMGLQVVGTSVTLTRGDILYSFDGMTESTALLTITMVPVTELTPADVAGWWSVTSQLLRNPNNLSQTHEFNDEKVGMTFEITAGGNFSMYDIRYPESDDDTNADDVNTEPYELVGNVMILGTAPNQMAVQLTPSGSDFILRYFDGHDWDGDSERDWSVLIMTLESVTEPSLASLAGTWVASDWDLIEYEGTGATYDAIANHETFTMVVDGAGNFEMLQSAPADSFERNTGTLAIHGNVLEINGGPGEDPMYMLFSLGGGAMEFTKAEWTDPFETGTSSAFRLEARLEAYTPATSADFVGDWVSNAFVFTEIDNPTNFYDMVGEGGSFSMTIVNDGTFSFSLTFPGETTENSTGTWEIFGDMLVITDNADGWVSAMQYTVGTGYFSMLSNDDSFDFDENGTDEDALLLITMVPPSR